MTPVQRGKLSYRLTALQWVVAVAFAVVPFVPLALWAVLDAATLAVTWTDSSGLLLVGCGVVLGVVGLVGQVGFCWALNAWIPPEDVRRSVMRAAAFWVSSILGFVICTLLAALLVGLAPWVASQSG